jgi:hypothetical protein
LYNFCFTSWAGIFRRGPISYMCTNNRRVIILEWPEYGRIKLWLYVRSSLSCKS